MLRYAITDCARFAGDEQKRQIALVCNAARWATAGVDFIQIREKDLHGGALATLARKLLEALSTGESAARMLINSRADVAIAVAAAGVHLTAAPGELTPAQVHRLYAAAGLFAPLVSVSCHTLAQVANARDSGASLILFGPVFEKVASAKGAGDRRVAAGCGLDQLRAACAAAVPTPVLALGGITQANTSACLAAGAAGIAAIRLFAQ